MSLNEARLHGLFQKDAALRDLVHSGALESVKPGEQKPAPVAELLSDAMDPMNGWRCGACGYWHKADVLSEKCPAKCEDCGLPFRERRGLGTGHCAVCSKVISQNKPLCFACRQHADATV